MTTSTKPDISLTPAAAAKVKELFQADEESKGKFLRVAVLPGGCSGYEYGFAFDEKREGDVEFPYDGFTMIVDPKSGQFLSGSRIDYYSDPTKQGFKIENPNVKSTCGCGKSNQF